MPANAAKPSGAWKTVLAVVVLIALGVSIGYQFMSEDQSTIVPVTRTPFDFTVTWRCLKCGHTLEDNAAVGPRVCPKCSANEMYVSIRFACPQHGAYNVAFQYDEQAHPTQIKIENADWVPVDNAEGLSNRVCPRCGQSLMPAEASRGARSARPRG